MFVHGKEDFLPQDSQYLIQSSSNETSRKEDILTTPNCSDALAFQSRRLVSSLPEIT